MSRCRKYNVHQKKKQAIRRQEQKCPYRLPRVRRSTMEFPDELIDGKCVPRVHLALTGKIAGQYYPAWKWEENTDVRECRSVIPGRVVSPSEDTSEVDQASEVESVIPAFTPPMPKALPETENVSGPIPSGGGTKAGKETAATAAVRSSIVIVLRSGGVDSQRVNISQIDILVP